MSFDGVLWSDRVLQRGYSPRLAFVFGWGVVGRTAFACMSACVSAQWPGLLFGRWHMVAGGVGCGWWAAACCRNAWQCLASNSDAWYGPWHGMFCGSGWPAQCASKLSMFFVCWESVAFAYVYVGGHAGLLDITPSDLDVVMRFMGICQAWWCSQSKLLHA